MMFRFVLFIEENSETLWYFCFFLEAEDYKCPVVAYFYYCVFLRPAVQTEATFY